MNFIEKFQLQTELISKFGEEKAFIVWVVGQYLNHPDFVELGTEGLTDGNDDKKMDFVWLDAENKRLIVVQSAYTTSNAFYKASANKASDLNTALAWLFSGNIEQLRDTTSDNYIASLREIAGDVRIALEKGEIDDVEVLYIHNKAESKNVRDELETVKAHIEKILSNNEASITITVNEIGAEEIERIVRYKDAAIIIDDKIILPTTPKFKESSSEWNAAIFTIDGEWLKQQFDTYGPSLFSANYRGFLGISKRGRKKINSGIKSTTETEPDNFWAFNNGITILTAKISEDITNNETTLDGISIINGAQTTGSISQSTQADLKKVKILCRVIEATNATTISSIIEYNNTQNEITSWDKYSKSPEQERIAQEFSGLGYEYSFKRGLNTGELGIELVAQPTAALQGLYLEASNGKNKIFERYYGEVFNNAKAKHLLLAYCLQKAIDINRLDLNNKSNENRLTLAEQNSLSLLKHLKFKHFLMAIIGECFEEIVGERVDINEIAFGNGIAGIRHNTVEQLVQHCIPLTRQMLGITARTISGDFSEIVYDRQQFAAIATSVKNSISAIKESVPHNAFAAFATLIAPRG